MRGGTDCNNRVGRRTTREPAQALVCRGGLRYPPCMCCSGRFPAPLQALESSHCAAIGALNYRHLTSHFSCRISLAVTSHFSQQLRNTATGKLDRSAPNPGDAGQCWKQNQGNTWQQHTDLQLTEHWEVERTTESALALVHQAARFGYPALQTLLAWVSAQFAERYICCRHTARPLVQTAALRSRQAGHITSFTL
jgi:hypothetical protein